MLASEKQRRALLSERQVDAMRRNARRARERVVESDEAVEREAEAVSPDLARAWRLIGPVRRARIKGNSRRSRAEAWLEWADGHANEIAELLSREAEVGSSYSAAELAEWEAEDERASARPLLVATLDDDDLPF